MPARFFYPGDTFSTDIHVCYRDDETDPQLPLFVILNVYGEVFFAPSFRNSVDYYELTVPFGESRQEILPPFQWPEGVGEAYGITWFAALTDPAITTVLGEMDMATFGWSE